MRLPFCRPAKSGEGKKFAAVKRRMNPAFAGLANMQECGIGEYLSEYLILTGLQEIFAPYKNLPVF